MRLNFPQKLAMSKICVQYAYFDIFSEEVGTGNEKKITGASEKMGKRR